MGLARNDIPITAIAFVILVSSLLYPGSAPVS
jgi:hypothetical protein